MGVVGMGVGGGCWFVVGVWVGGGGGGGGGAGGVLDVSSQKGMNKNALGTTREGQSTRSFSGVKANKIEKHGMNDSNPSVPFSFYKSSWWWWWWWSSLFLLSRALAVHAEHSSWFRSQRRGSER